MKLLQFLSLPVGGIDDRPNMNNLTETIIVPKMSVVPRKGSSPLATDLYTFK